MCKIRLSGNSLRRFSCRTLLAASLAVAGGNAIAIDAFDFTSPSLYPYATPLSPNNSIAIRICANKKWIEDYVGKGALWPGHYGVKFEWKGMKWNWALPATLPTAAELAIPESDQYCSAPLTVKYLDFPAQGQWQVQARIQLNNGFTTGPMTRVIEVLAPTNKSAPTSNVKAMPGPMAVPPGASAGQQQDSQRPGQLPGAARSQINPGAPTAPQRPGAPQQ
jgi:hypothetical protein